MKGNYTEHTPRIVDGTKKWKVIESYSLKNGKIDKQEKSKKNVPFHRFPKYYNHLTIFRGDSTDTENVYFDVPSQLNIDL